MRFCAITLRCFITLISTLLTVNSFAGPSHLKQHQFSFPELPYTSYVNFPSATEANPIEISAQLRIPKGYESQKIPAVVIMHGSAGVDSRGSLYTLALNEAGIATLEVDLWAARGWTGSVSGRPSGVPETVPDAFGALKFLSTQPGIDANNIGILGFSWGGVITMLAATQPYADQFGQDLRFASHIANYPVCWAYNTFPGYEFYHLTGAPVLIQSGELDTYDLPDTCSNLVSSLPNDAQGVLAHRQYRGATHAWDRLQPEMIVTDPYACLGSGCEVTFTPNLRQAIKSQRKVVRFFRQTLNN